MYISIILYYNMFKYIKLADILQHSIHKRKQLKELIYGEESHKQKHLQKGTAKVNPRVAYSNLSLILNNLNKFQQFYKQLCKSMRKKQEKIISNKYLLFVMVAEWINVGKIVGGGGVKKVIMANLTLLPDVQVQSKINKCVTHIRLRKCYKQQDKQEYIKWRKLLNTFGTKNQIIPNLFNLQQKQYSKLVHKQPDLRTTPACVVQSFSSNLPPFLLFKGLNTQKNKNRKFDIIDACSAPGNKTLQLAEYLGDRGTIFAFQKDERRFGTLCRNVDKYRASNIQPYNLNFLQALPENFPRVKLVLLDPSCSGSGMLTNFTRDNNDKIDSIQDQETSFQQFIDSAYKNLSKEESQRILQLKQFQIQLLRKSAEFKPQRICYSTCSIFRQQNQQVVAQFLQNNPNYEIKPVLKIQQLDGQLQRTIRPGFGQLYRNCIRIDPRGRLSDGFFVCVFARLET